MQTFSVGDLTLDRMFKMFTSGELKSYENGFISSTATVDLSKRLIIGKGFDINGRELNYQWCFRPIDINYAMMNNLCTLSCMTLRFGFDESQKKGIMWIFLNSDLKYGVIGFGTDHDNEPYIIKGEVEFDTVNSPVVNPPRFRLHTYHTSNLCEVLAKYTETAGGIVLEELFNKLNLNKD